MATPKTDITLQSIGRILRANHPMPRVIDVVDSHMICLKGRVVKE